MDEEHKESPARYGLSTRIIHAGRSDPRTVSSPVYHASTVLFRDYQELVEREAAPNDRAHMYYGRKGTPTTRALEDALSELDGSLGAILSPSGVASITDVLLCFLKPGDELLMVDNAYGPTRRFCQRNLAERGIATRFYDPLLGVDIEAMLAPNTRMIFMESPGSATMEVQDVPALTKVAKAAGILTAIDNTWATPLLFNPLDFGVDLAIQSGTKYLNGHADCFFGVTTSRDKSLLNALARYTQTTGSHLAPDDANLALRGLRTLPVRLAQHERNTEHVLDWLRTRPEVSKLLHPEQPEHPGHAFYTRDFQGGSGLFSMVLELETEERLARFVNALSLFGIGFSWGGFESLCLPMQADRSVSSFTLKPGEFLVRLHIGLEDPDDLLDDLAKAFAVSAP
ncbi:MAG: cystathionine beta-lyase [Pseudomonadota bacterium]